MKTNPLRIDPTRTIMLRRAFLSKLKGRFKRIERALIQLVEFEDSFGLKRDGRFNRVSNTSLPYAANERWRFLTDEQKLREFEAWLREQFGREVLGADEEALWRAYVEDGYRRGAGRAFDDVNRVRRFSPGEREFFEGSRREFLHSAFARPIAVERVKLLAARALTDLKGVTDVTATTMLRTLTDGLVRGLSPREVARQLVERLDGVGLSRALTIARTEIVRAHAEGQLDGFELLGVEEVGVAVEWSTAAHACPLCVPMDGVVLKVKESRGLIPRHPNCRCAWIPANVGEPKGGQKRTKPQIKRAVGKSVKEETGERTVREAKEESRWAGADLDPSKERPKGILNAEQLAEFVRDMETIIKGS